jgi:hypothetical protein
MPKVGPFRLRCIPMAMNSAQDADPDVPDAEPADLDSEALQRANEAIDQGRDAAREALKDNPPEPVDDTDGQSERSSEP